MSEEQKEEWIGLQEAVEYIMKTYGLDMEYAWIQIHDGIMRKKIKANGLIEGLIGGQNFSLVTIKGFDQAERLLPFENNALIIEALPFRKIEETYIDQCKVNKKNLPTAQTPRSRKSNLRPQYIAKRVRDWVIENNIITLSASKTLINKIEDDLGLRPSPKTVREGLKMAKEIRDQKK